MKQAFICVFLLGFAGVALAGWQPIDSITNSPGISDFTCENNGRSAACDQSGNIHVVWRTGYRDSASVRYRRWDAASRGWSSEATLWSGPSGDPALGLDTLGNLWVAWTSGSCLRLMRRQVETGAWETKESLPGSQYDTAVSISVDVSGAVHAVWERAVAGNCQVRYAEYGSGGWTRAESLGMSLTAVGRPSLAVADGGDLLAVWASSGSPNPLLVRRRTGTAWLAPETLYRTARASSPCVCGDTGSSFHVVWIAGSSPQAIVYRCLRSGQWDDTVRLTTSQYTKTGPSICRVDGALHAAWAGLDSSAQTYPQVFWRSRDSTGQWQPQRLMTSGEGQRSRVTVYGGAGTIQVTWTEAQTQLLPSDVRMCRYENLHDVGALRIDWPPSIVDSGTVLPPKAWVTNYGNLTELNIPVRFSFDGYCDVETLPFLAPYDVDRVFFDSTVLRVRGVHVVRCSTAMAGDAKPSNDAVSDTFFVRVQDVAVRSVLVPIDTVWEDTITPCLSVSNLGNVPESLAAVFAIDGGSMYADTVSVLLASGQDTVLRFRDWPTTPGQFTARGWVMCQPDMRPENDTAETSFVVVRLDAAVEEVLSPTGVVDSGQALTPSARVRNMGSVPRLFEVVMRIDAERADTVLVADLLPDSERVVVFDTWTAGSRGTHAVRCTTMLSHDRNPANDVLCDSVFVRVRDAVAASIVTPCGTVSHGPLSPLALVRNDGNEACSLVVCFSIAGDSAVYVDSVTAMLGAESDTVLQFAEWQATRGSYTCRCWTALSGDMHPENDTVGNTFFVPGVDAAARAIVSPPVRITEGEVVPKVLVANLGDEAASFTARFGITQNGTAVYDDTVPVTFLAPLDSVVVSFAPWAAAPGSCDLYVQLDLSGDENPANDTLGATLLVDSLESRYWKQLSSVPGGPHRTGVKGGALTAAGDRLVCLKGSNTLECYGYDVSGDSWSRLADMPAGDSGYHRVRSGAALCCDGSGRVLALKGNNTRELWRYDLSRDTWLPETWLPERTLPVKFASGLAACASHDTDFVYCLKGSNTADFYVYWSGLGQWHARRSLPSEDAGSRAKRGSCLAGFSGRVFFLRGGTGELAEYLPATDSWARRASLPLAGRGFPRRCRAGAALASDGTRYLYAFKGGRRNDLWRYDAVANSWVQLDDIPMGNDRRRVKDGAALAWLGGKLYALKGGGCNELWCFDPEAGDAGRLTLDAGQKAQGKGQECRRLGAECGPECMLFDVTGRRVSEGTSVRPGVYFTLTRSADSLHTRKVVVTK
jgi:hypothetical protein